MTIPSFIYSGFMIEFIYTIIVVFFCFVIYVKTKESYDLTKHKGIRHFRNAFLLFGFSYVMRFFVIAIFFSGFKFGFVVSRDLLAILSMVFTGYLSTLAIFNLIYSSVWKKINDTYFTIISHIAAVISALLVFITASHAIAHEMLFYLQSIIMIIAIVLSLLLLKKKNISSVKIFYTLIFVFWLINLWAIAPRNILSVEIKLIFQIISIIVFVIVYYKVSKWLK